MFDYESKSRLYSMTREYSMTFILIHKNLYIYIYIYIRRFFKSLFKTYELEVEILCSFENEKQQQPQASKIFEYILKISQICCR